VKTTWTKFSPLEAFLRVLILRNAKSQTQTIMTTPTETDALVTAVNEGSARWIAAFNSGDAQGCAEAYEGDAVMNAHPMGTFNGRTEILAFWTKLIGDGFAEVEYIDPQVEVLDSSKAVIKASWKMNKAKGIIHRELWVLQKDGTAKLRADDFEVTG